ncbi:Dolichyldiphosphatase 1 [Oopsacas minuta]|uniref:Dolichyldiphosphatase 1 n=1 Tax=Oopsacas minuta TaxID=111878 RepID=A0AAV7JXL7_9METZ|nr:Dolichyldiphosphatase 1 [Oopsacas minuta]
MEWETLSLTCVEHQKDDLFAKLMALFSLSPLVISISLATFMFCKRDTYSIIFSIGLVLNFVMVQVEKIIIKEPRPPGGPGERSLFQYGMPSMHCQFVSFFALFLTLSIILRWKMSLSSKSFYLFAINVILFGTCVSRVYLLYHTVRQVIVGVVVGACLGVTWYYLTKWVSYYVNRFILSSTIAEYFCIRNLGHLEDATQFEYDIAMRSLMKNQ